MKTIVRNNIVLDIYFPGNDITIGWGSWLLCRIAKKKARYLCGDMPTEIREATINLVNQLLEVV